MGGFGSSSVSRLESFVRPTHPLLELSCVCVGVQCNNNLVSAYSIYTKHSSQVGVGNTKTNRMLSLPSRSSGSYWKRDLWW